MKKRMLDCRRFWNRKFYQKYMDLASMHSGLIVPNREKVKQYLKEIKLV